MASICQLDSVRLPEKAVEACKSGDWWLLRDMLVNNEVFDKKAYLKWRDALGRNLWHPDSKESTIMRQLIRIAAHHKQVKVVENLLDVGVSRSDPVSQAIELGSGEALELFIARNPKIPFLARYHVETYLCVGLPLPEWKAMLCFETLLKNGGSPNKPYPIMNNVIQTGNPRLVALVDGYGGKPNKINFIGRAAETGSIELVQYLLDCGADVNFSYEFDEGWTALHKAANKGNLAMVEFLLNHGANATIKGDIGETAFDVADGSEKSEIREVLTRSVAILDVHLSGAAHLGSVGTA